MTVPERINVINLSTDEPDIYLDAQKIEASFKKIIQKAFDAIPEKGSLKISIESKESYIEISFQDSGTGISEEILPKLLLLS